jgi:hypothetical protein
MLVRDRSIAGCTSGAIALLDDFAEEIRSSFLLQAIYCSN